VTYPGEQSGHLPAAGGVADGTREVLHPRRAGHPAHQLCHAAGRRRQCHASPDAPRQAPCPAPAGCVPRSLPATSVFGVSRDAGPRGGSPSAGDPPPKVVPWDINGDARGDGDKKGHRE